MSGCSVSLRLFGEIDKRTIDFVDFKSILLYFESISLRKGVLVSGSDRGGYRFILSFFPL